MTQKLPSIAQMKILRGIACAEDQCVRGGRGVAELDILVRKGYLSKRWSEIKGGQTIPVYTLTDAGRAIVTSPVAAPTRKELIAALRKLYRAFPLEAECEERNRQMLREVEDLLNRLPQEES